VGRVEAQEGRQVGRVEPGSHQLTLNLTEMRDIEKRVLKVIFTSLHRSDYTVGQKSKLPPVSLMMFITLRMREKRCYFDNMHDKST